MLAGLKISHVRPAYQDKDHILRLSITGSFDFNIVREFREAYSSLSETPRKIIVDLRHTESIDSAALGMLLNMKKHFNKDDREIEIHNCSSAVKRILSIARFDILFRID